MVPALPCLKCKIKDCWCFNPLRFSLMCYSGLDNWNRPKPGALTVTMVPNPSSTQLQLPKVFEQQPPRTRPGGGVGSGMRNSFKPWCLGGPQSSGAHNQQHLPTPRPAVGMLSHVPPLLQIPAIYRSSPCALVCFGDHASPLTLARPLPRQWLGSSADGGCPLPH